MRIYGENQVIKGLVKMINVELAAMFDRNLNSDQMQEAFAPMLPEQLSVADKISGKP